MEALFSLLSAGSADSHVDGKFKSFPTKFYPSTRWVDQQPVMHLDISAGNVKLRLQNPETLPGTCIYILDHPAVFQVTNHSELGTKLAAGNEVLLTKWQLNRIPHASVLAALDLLEESCKLRMVRGLSFTEHDANLTPDCIMCAEKTNFILEVKTRKVLMPSFVEPESWRYYSVLQRSAMTREEFDTYYHEIFVGQNGICCSSQVPLELREQVLEFYNTAVNFVKGAGGPYSEAETKEMLEKAEIMRSVLSDLDFTPEDQKTNSLILTEKDFQEFQDHAVADSWDNKAIRENYLTKLVNNSFNLSADTLITEQKDETKNIKLLNQYEKQVNIPCAKRTQKSIVQFPLVLAKIGNFTSDELLLMNFGSGDAHSNLWSECYAQMLESRSTIICTGDASTWYNAMRDSSGIIHNSTRKSANKVVARLSGPEKIALSMLAIKGKSMKHVDEKRLKDESSRKPFRSDCDTSDVDAFLNDCENLMSSTPEGYKVTEHPMITRVLELVESGILPSDRLPVGERGSISYSATLSSIRKLFDKKFFSACTLIASMCSEINYDRISNVGDNEYFMKKIPGYRALMIVKPTNASNHIFFTIAIPKTEALILCQKPFTVMRESGDWYITEFRSSREEKLDSHLYAYAKMLGVYTVLKQVFNVGEDPFDVMCSKDSEAALDRQENFLKHFFIASLIYLEDRGGTTMMLQNVRYIIMHSLSASRMRRCPAMLLTKFPKLLRSRLEVFLFKRISTYIKVYSPKLNVNVKWCARDTPESFRPLDSTESSLDKAVNLFSPLTLKPVHSLECILTVPYLCHMHNKDTSSGVAGSFQIVSKIIKSERTTKNASKDLMSCKARAKTMILKEHESCRKVVAYAAAEVVDRLAKYDLEDELCLELSKKTLFDLATFKSSANSLRFEEHRIYRKGPDNKPPRRIKCIEAVLRLLNEFGYDINTPMHKVPDLLRKLEESNEERSMHVHVFKKNQLGGVREILILDINARIAIFSLETISRWIGTRLPNEMLTKGDKKLKSFQDYNKMTSERLQELSAERDRLVNEKKAEYRSIRAQLGDEHQIVKSVVKPQIDVVRASMAADASTWCQGFVMPVFGKFLCLVLPKLFHPLICRVLNLVTRKRIVIPEETCDLMDSHPNEKSFDENVQYLIDSFHGTIGDSEIMPFSRCRYITNKSNFMQGILHYTSSVLHSAFLLSLYNPIKKVVFAKLGKIQAVEVDIHSRVSSDDSSMNITAFVLNISSETKSAVKMVLDLSLMSVEGLYNLFCAKSSLEKTVCSLPGSISEFNSEWTVHNTLIRPIIKFLLPCFLTPMNLKFEDRVRSAYQSLGACLEAGLSFGAARVLMVLMAMAHYDSMGLLNTPNSSVICDLIERTKHPALGFFPMDSQLSPGLMGYRRARSLHLFEFKEAKETESILGSSLLDGEGMYDPAGTELWFSMGNESKYNAYLKSLGYTVEDLRIQSAAHVKAIMGIVEDKDSLRAAISHKLLNRGFMSTNLIGKTCRLHATGVYVLRAPCLKLRIMHIKEGWTAFVISEVSKIIERNINESGYPIRDMQTLRPHKVYEGIIAKVSLKSAVEIIEMLRQHKCLHLVESYRESLEKLYVAHHESIMRPDLWQVGAGIVRSKRFITMQVPDYVGKTGISLKDALTNLWFTVGHKSISDDSLDAAVNHYKRVFPWIRNTLGASQIAGGFPTPLALAGFINGWSSQDNSMRLLTCVSLQSNFDDTVRSIVRLNQWPGLELKLRVKGRGEEHTICTDEVRDLSDPLYFVSTLKTGMDSHSKGLKRYVVESLCDESTFDDQVLGLNKLKEVDQMIMEYALAIKAQNAFHNGLESSNSDYLSRDYHDKKVRLFERACTSSIGEIKQSTGYYPAVRASINMPYVMSPHDGRTTAALETSRGNFRGLQYVSQIDGPSHCRRLLRLYVHSVDVIHENPGRFEQLMRKLRFREHAIIEIQPFQVSAKTFKVEFSVEAKDRLPVIACDLPAWDYNFVDRCKIVVRNRCLSICQNEDLDHPLQKVFIKGTKYSFELTNKTQLMKHIVKGIDSIIPGDSKQIRLDKETMSFWYKCWLLPSSKDKEQVIKNLGILANRCGMRLQMRLMARWVLLLLDKTAGSNLNITQIVHNHPSGIFQEADVEDDIMPVEAREIEDETRLTFDIQQKILQSIDQASGGEQGFIFEPVGHFEPSREEEDDNTSDSGPEVDENTIEAEHYILSDSEDSMSSGNQSPNLYDNIKSVEIGALPIAKIDPDSSNKAKNRSLTKFILKQKVKNITLSHDLMEHYRRVEQDMESRFRSMLDTTEADTSNAAELNFMNKDAIRALKPETLDVTVLDVMGNIEGSEMLAHMLMIANRPEWDTFSLSASGTLTMANEAINRELEPNGSSLSAQLNLLVHYASNSSSPAVRKHLESIYNAVVDDRHAITPGV